MRCVNESTVFLMQKLVRRSTMGTTVLRGLCKNKDVSERQSTVKIPVTLNMHSNGPSSFQTRT